MNANKTGNFAYKQQPKRLPGTQKVYHVKYLQTHGIGRLLPKPGRRHINGSDSMHDLFIFRIKTAAIRRCILLLLSPFIFFLFSIVRLTSALSWIFPDFRDMFLDVWHGVKREDELLPCPFCGGRCNPDGWMTMSGASGPSCADCGSTAYNGDVWNRRAGK